MANEASERAFADVAEVIAANLHRLRTARRMSLATLAARADVAKATLANLEQGRGNPTIETLWSLALGLGVAFSDLLEDRRETTMVVVRSQQGARIRGSTRGGKLDLRLLDRIERGGLVEVFALFLPARTEHGGKPRPGSDRSGGIRALDVAVLPQRAQSHSGYRCARPAVAQR